jgi:hypothetical protein
MVAEKNMRFTGKNTDLNQLQQRVEQELKNEGYKTQSTRSTVGYLLQAQKSGILRDIFSANRAFTILISGQPDDFSVHIGIGKWLQNIGVAAVETVLLSGLFLAVDVPEMAWTMHVENGIAQMIQRMVGSSPSAQQTGGAEMTMPAASQQSSSLPSGA